MARRNRFDYSSVPGESPASPGPGPERLADSRFAGGRASAIVAGLPEISGAELATGPASAAGPAGPPEPAAAPAVAGTIPALARHTRPSPGANANASEINPITARTAANPVANGPDPFAVSAGRGVGAGVRTGPIAAGTTAAEAVDAVPAPTGLIATTVNV
jgi:hypothetical protein